MNIRYQHRIAILSLLTTCLCVAGIAQETDFEETRKKAETGDADSQYSLGMKYAYGEGVEKDVTEAIRWLRKAAEQGLVIAQFNLGQMYAKGDGVDEDDAEAYTWLSLAAANGDERSTRACDLLASKLSPEVLMAAEKHVTELQTEIDKRMREAE